jgi:hypothetical protein
VGVVQQLFTDCKRAIASIGKKVFYNIIIDFIIAIKSISLIKMCLSGAYFEVHTGKHLFDLERPKTRGCFIATAINVALECFFLVSCLFYFLALKIEAVRYPETSVDFYSTTRR